MTPTRLGRYEIRSVLGSGAMGTVYAGWDPALSRGVAIKVIQGALGERDLERFQREAQTLARLIHPNIVAIHDIGTHDEAPFIVMELIHGHTLAREIADGVSRSAPQKVRLAAQLCDALAFANAAGVIHRDVKPANVLLTTEGVAKLADFGVARLQNSSLTGTANLVGTPAYLAPEAFSGTELDGRADVYGIAATLFEWLSGARPHDAENLAALMAKVLNLDAPDIRQHWRECPAPLAECLRRGLARDRGERHQSAKDFADALRAMDFAGDAMVQGTTVLLDARVARGPSSYASRTVLTAAAIVAAVGFAMLAMSINVPSEPVAEVVSTAAVSPVRPAPVPATEAARTGAPVTERAKFDATRRSAPAASVPAPTLATPAPAPIEQTAEEIIEPPASVPVGTDVKISMRTDLSLFSESSRGMFFEAVLAAPVIFGGREVAPAGAPVRGIVDQTHNLKGAITNDLSLVSISIGDRPIRIRTNRYQVALGVPVGQQLTFKLAAPLRLQSDIQ